MISKERRAELRRSWGEPWSREDDRGVLDALGIRVIRDEVSDRLPSATAQIVSEHEAIPELLDALDEMELARDRAAGTRDGLAVECNRVAGELGIRDDESAVLAIRSLNERLAAAERERDQWIKSAERCARERDNATAAAGEGRLAKALLSTGRKKLHARIVELERERDELEGLFRELGIRRLNPGGTKRTALEIWNDLVGRP